MADIPLLHKLEAAVFHLQEPTNEMGALQTVQGTTYDGIIRFLIITMELAIGLGFKRMVINSEK